MSRDRPPVLHFIDTTGPGGAETVFLHVAQGLWDRGWPGRILLVGPGWVLDRARRLDVPVDLVETRGPVDLHFMRALHRLVRQHRIGLIHAHLLSPAVYASAIGRWSQIPVVATYHGASDTEAVKWTRVAQHCLVSRHASVVCVSDALRRNLLGIPGMPTHQGRVIHNGVDLEAFASADGRAVRMAEGIPDDAFLVGALGNMRPAKDYPTLLQAAAELANDRRFIFAIVGQKTEPLHAQLVKLRGELRLSDRVFFWGFRSDVPEILAAFDALVISSRSEGFSLAAIQAMAGGTPVVATRSGGPEGIITDGADGLLVPTGSPAALARGIRKLAEAPGLRERFAIMAEKTVRDRFSLSAMLDKYDALYEAVALGQTPGPGTHM